MKQNFFPLISLGNELPVLPAGQMVAGQISLANEERFTAANYSEALTAYTVGWRPPQQLQEMLDHIAPRVPVARRFEFKKAENAEALLVDTDDERAIGSGFKRVEYKGTSANGKTKNRGLCYRLDRDEEGGVLTEENIVAMLRERMLRNSFKRGLTVLLALAHNTAKVWDGNGTPDDDMAAAIEAAQIAGGVFPNRALVGLSAWNLRRKSYAGQDKAGAYAGLGLTPQQVGEGLGLESLKLSSELYQFSKSEKKRILESIAVFFYAQNSLSKDDPSHVKRFVTPLAGGDYRVYRQEVGAKFIDISVETYEDIVGTSTVGAEKITATAT